MEAGLPLVLEEDLATARDLVATVANGESGAYAASATELLRVTVERRGRHLRVQATMTDVSTQGNRAIVEVAADDALGATNILAKRIDAGATGFSTHSQQALKLFAGAASASDLQTRMQLLEGAIQVDPAFGLAQLALASLVAQVNPERVPAVIEAGKRQAAAFNVVDRARFDTFAAQSVHLPLARQEAGLRSLLQIAPNNVDALSALGSLRFTDGDEADGTRLLNQALAINPDRVSVREQLGQGLLQSRRFSEAEKMFSSLDANGTVLPALAVSILLEGDVKRADTISQRLNQSLSLNLRPFFWATWLTLSGRGSQGLSLLGNAATADPGMQSLAATQASIWQLMLGNGSAAKESSLVAARLAGPLSAESALLTKLDGSVGQWRDEVNSSALKPTQKQLLLGYGLFLAGHYPEAAEQWHTILQQSGGIDLRARAMLAASFDRSGRADQARKILVQPFVPVFGDLYAAVSFGEMRRLLNLQVR